MHAHTMVFAQQAQPCKNHNMTVRPGAMLEAPFVHGQNVEMGEEC